RPFRRHPRVILKWLITLLVTSALIALIWPAHYIANSRILPPQTSQGSAFGMLGQLNVLAGLGGKDFGLKNPADLYVGILKSRSVADSVVQRYQLQEYYKD